MFNQPFLRFLAALAANEGYGDWLARSARFMDGIINRFRNFLRVGNGSFAVKYSHAINPGMCIGILDAFVVACQTCAAGDIHRVLGGTERRHVFFELFLHVLRSEL